MEIAMKWVVVRKRLPLLTKQWMRA
jgi:hypothetical protein